MLDVRKLAPVALHNLVGSFALVTTPFSRSIHKGSPVHTFKFFQCAKQIFGYALIAQCFADTMVTANITIPKRKPNVLRQIITVQVHTQAARPIIV